MPAIKESHYSKEHYLGHIRCYISRNRPHKNTNRQQDFLMRNLTNPKTF